MTERTAHALYTETVLECLVPCDLRDRVVEVRDLPQPLGHLSETLCGDPESLELGLRQPIFFSAGDVRGVGPEDVVLCGDERRGQITQVVVLLLGRQRRHVLCGVPCGLGRRPYLAHP